MKFLKVLGVIFGLIVLAAGVLWFAMLRAPSVEDQCDHVLTLMEAKTPGFTASPVGEEFLSGCPDKMKKGSLQGAAPYAKQAKCVMAAGSLEELDNCSK